MTVLAARGVEGHAIPHGRAKLIPHLVSGTSSGLAKETPAALPQVLPLAPADSNQSLGMLFTFPVSRRPYHSHGSSHLKTPEGFPALERRLAKRPIRTFLMDADASDPPLSAGIFFDSGSTSHSRAPAG